MFYSYYIKILLKKYIPNRDISNLILVGSVILFVKLVAFYKEICIGNTLGLSLILDTFFIAVLIPGFINNVFASSFQNVFIPNYINLIHSKSNVSSFQSTCFILSVILALFLSIIAYFFTDLFLQNIFPNKLMSYYFLIREQFYILLPCILIWSISSILLGLLQAHEFFIISFAYPIITSISILTCLLFFDILGIKTLAFGVLIGSILELIFLTFIGIKKKLIRFSMPNFNDDSIKILLKQFPIKTASSLITGSTGFVTQYFAANLVIGSIAAINYGTKIPSLINMIITTAVGSISLTYFSKLILIDKGQAYKNLNRILIYLFVFTTVLSVVIYFYSHNIIEILFQRKKFTSVDTTRVTSIQQILILYSPFYCCSILLISFLTSMNKNKFMFYASIINLFINLLLSKYLILLMDIKGLALANFIMYFVNFLVLFSFYSWQYQRDYKK